MSLNDLFEISDHEMTTINNQHHMSNFFSGCAVNDLPYHHNIIPERATNIILRYMFIVIQ